MRATHARRLFTAFILSLALVVACDDGTTPDAVGGGDAGQPDAGARDAAVATGCDTPDARRCGADGVEICAAGQWVPVGPCAEGDVCDEGLCVPESCEPRCGERVCGGNGCGGVCGECGGGDVCSVSGTCEPPAARCGDDACNGEETCDTCPADCGRCCGDGVCEDGRDEDCATCLADCDCVAPESCSAETRLCEACDPQCAGRECGDDGCGSTCGDCDAGVACVNGLCDVGCQPQCAGRVCGADGCGDVCGRCDGGNVCNAAGRCEPPPERCGDDACGDGEDCANCPADCGQCCGDGACDGPGGENCATCLADCACPAGEACNPQRAVCVRDCVPQCAGRNCGDNGCGGVCGNCVAGQSCEAGVCRDICQPDCNNRVCGGNGCGGSCGLCDGDQLCNDGQCEDVCHPACAGRQCGADGCGGFCGQCDPDEVCSAGACVVDCQPRCAGRQCGDDGCGASCGDCPGDDRCNANGVCEPVCSPNCAGRVCGDNGCGGQCGQCGQNERCTAGGQCEPICQRQCDGRACGPDGCGGQCGQCQNGELCDDAGRCHPDAEFCDCVGDQVCLDGFCREPDQLCSADNPIGLCPAAHDCIAGECESRGAACSRGNPTGICELGEVCRDGACVPFDGSALCNDDQACTADLFDHVRNRCTNRPVAGACTDGNGCTRTHCEAGACVAEPIAGCLEPPAIDPYVTPTNDPVLVLRGSKPGGSSVRINGQVAVVENPDERWSVNINLQPGENRFEIRSVDRGQQSEAVVIVIVYDNVLPTIEVTPAGGVFLNGVTVTVTASEPATVYYTTDGGTPQRWSKSFRSVKQFRVFDDTALRFRAVDIAGNEQADITEADFEITSYGNRWTAGAQLPEPLTLPGAAVLGDAIYLVGGTDGDAAQAGAHRYDLQTGEWTLEAAMPSARAHLSVVALGGSLYAIGGEDDGEPQNRVQRLQPGGQAWEDRAPMPSTRFGLGAVAYNNRIYAFGGQANGGAVLPNLEVYDPANNTWSNQAAQMPRPRYGHAAVEHRGRIYLLGGQDEGGLPIAEVDVYIVGEDRWAQAPDLPTPRAFATATKNYNVGHIDTGYVGIVVAGGQVAGGAPTAVVEEYVVEDDHWRERTPLPVPRHSGVGVTTEQAGSVDDREARSWILGGLTGRVITADMSYFTQDQDYARALPALPAGRFMHAGQSLDGHIYLFGGRDFQETRLVWSFDPETGSYEELPELPSFQSGLGSAVLDGRIYAVGGADNFGNARATVRFYDRAERRWVDVRPMQSARRDTAVAVLGGELYVIGGFNNGALQTVEIYDPAADRWRAGPVLPAGRSGARAVIHRGEIVLVGGVDGNGALHDTVLRFTDDQWQQAYRGIAVAHAAVALQHDNQLNVFGGRAQGGIANTIWSLNLDNNQLTRDVEGAQNLLRGVDYAALVSHNGEIYVFGGNANPDLGPEGQRTVQKLRGHCFDGVLDGREERTDQTPYDRGGGCPDVHNLYWAQGVQHNIADAALTGWRVCHSDGYGDSGTHLNNLQNACNGRVVLVGCRPTGSGSWQALAMANRADVFHNTGDRTNTLHRANGVDWYFSTSYSMGFVGQGTGVSRNSCDTANNSPGDRLCWHTSGTTLSSGYRCGANTSAGAGWDRRVWTAD